MSELDLRVSDWLGALRSEYLAGFVRDGGATVKVAVAPNPEVSASLTARLVADARELGFVAATVDAGQCKVHLLHNLFNEIARQVDWEALAREFVRSQMLAAGLALPVDGSLDVEKVAGVNDQDVTIVKQEPVFPISRKRLAELL